MRRHSRLERAVVEEELHGQVLFLVLLVEMVVVVMVV